MSYSDPKTLWKNVEKVISFKTPRQNNTTIIEDQNQIITNPNSISNAFNNYFVDVGRNLSNQIIDVDNTYSATNIIANNKEYVYFEPIVNEEILYLFLQLDTNKSTPSQFCPIKIIKIAAPVISPILTKIFNLCLLNGVYPKIFKTAEIIPIHKSGSKSSLTNYRPISLLTPFSKLLEKCIYIRTSNFLDKHNILYNSQFGFRNNSSTENAVLQLYNQLLTNISNKQITCSIFIDLKKAFDTVNHTILLQKLNRYGIRGVSLKLFESYLNDRSQYTLVNGSRSSCKAMNCGVPQGSTLGPLLFLLYINDLHLISNFSLTLFADDANLSLNNSNPLNLQNNVNDELVKISEWLCCNKLSLNLNKTQYLIVTNRKITHKFDIKVSGRSITQTDQIKYLGVIIDSKLNWEPHIKQVKNKLSNGCWALNKVKKYLNKKSLLQLYYGLIYSHLQYCVSCWGGANKTKIQKLNVMQNRSVRIINKTFEIRTKMSPLYSELNILKVNHIYEFQILKIMYRIDQENWLGNHKLIKTNSIHNYQTRTANSSNFFIEANKISKTSINKIGPKLWMKIPLSIKSLNFNNFKQVVRNTFIESY